jgi:hypothetical protein
MVADMTGVMARAGAVFKSRALKCGLASLAIAASAPPDPNAVVARGLTGDFDTRAQFEAADAALKVAPSVAGDWLDRQHAVMRIVDAPLIGTRVLYLEWRSGGPTGPVSRQRIWSFRQGRPAMTFYTFRDPKPFAGQADAAGAFRQLKPTDLVGYDEACDVRWAGRVGRIRPEDCRITAQSGRGMRLDVTIRLVPNGFSYREAGILDNGVRAFAVPPTMPYRFVRVAKR